MKYARGGRSRTGRSTNGKPSSLLGFLAVGIVMALVLTFASMTVLAQKAKTEQPVASEETQQTSHPETAEPQLEGTIKVNEMNEEQLEATQFSKMAKITLEEAQQAALQQHPGGSITASSLSDENGYLLYEITVVDGNDQAYTVKVDAGDASIRYDGVENEAESENESDSENLTEKNETASEHENDDGHGDDEEATGEHAD